MITKKCYCCEEIKNIDEFSADYKCKDGYRNICKKCAAKRAREYAAKDRAAYNLKHKLQREAHKDEINARYRQRLKDDPEFREKRNAKNRRCMANLQKKKPEYFMYDHAKRRAKIQNLPFNITPQDIHIPEYCPILGIKLQFHFGEKRAFFDSPSLDKIDPKLGYVKGNIAVISQQANTMKNNASKEMLTIFAQNILKYINKEDIVQTTENTESVES